MGRVLLVCRLASRDLRRRPAEAALLLLAIMGATTTLTLGLVLRGVTDKPYQSTREATAGPDVVAASGGEPFALAGLKDLTNAPGVVGHSGPYPVARAALKANGRTVAAFAEGRDSAPVSIDQPKLTQGSWVRDGGVVVEAAFADALGVGAGDAITMGGAVGAAFGDEPEGGLRDPVAVNGRSFRVVGVAVTAADATVPGGAVHRRHLHPRRPGLAHPGGCPEPRPAGRPLSTTP